MTRNFTIVKPEKKWDNLETWEHIVDLLDRVFKSMEITPQEEREKQKRRFSEEFDKSFILVPK
jgi:argininosuccinate lyase